MAARFEREDDGELTRRSAVKHSNCRRELPAYHDLTSPVQTSQMENSFAPIDVSPVEFHGPPPVLTSYVPGRERGSGPYQFVSPPHDFSGRHVAKDSSQNVRGQ